MLFVAAMAMCAASERARSGRRPAPANLLESNSERVSKGSDTICISAFSLAVEAVKSPFFASSTTRDDMRKVW